MSNKAENIKAYPCEKCKATGIVNGNSCENCLGSGFIGRDGVYEYILSKAENGRLVVKDIKMKELSQEKNVIDNKEWEKKKSNLFKNIFNSILIISCLILITLYLTVLNRNQSALTLFIILLMLILIFNLPFLNIDKRIKRIIKELWEEPNDLIKYISKLE